MTPKTPVLSYGILGLTLLSSTLACSSKTETIGIRRPAAVADASVVGTSQAGQPASEQPIVSSWGSGMPDSHELAVDIQDSKHVSLSLIQVGCQGECSDVEAIATDGYPPYSFVWEDGSIAATRTLCPTDVTTYRVTATDSGITSPEFSQAAESVSAEVKTQLTKCSEGASCTEDLALEATAHNDDGGDGYQTAWDLCVSEYGMAGFYNEQTTDAFDIFASLVGLSTYPAATEGETYLGMQSDNSVAHELCAPLVAGKPYSVKLDVSSYWVGVPPQLAINVSSDGCAGEAKTVWTSPMTHQMWQTYCATFTPDRAYTHLVLSMANPDDSPALLFVDNMVPVPNCDDLSQDAP